MNRLGLQALLRTVANSTASDGELLGRYLRERDEASFRMLVERYGRLVWSVCRHLTRTDADADDAFQATFLVLSQRAASIRKPESLGSWLYGVATRICTKSRKAADRRAKRERAVSRSETQENESSTSWDRAFAAVHEELGKLPETLRVPFVMCCLEGKGTSEAAAAVGWKLGTFSGRLTRAKDLLIARLDARGLTAGAVASTLIGIGAANAPATIIAKTVPLALSAMAIPRTILFLSQGVVEMNLHRVKLLAAAVILACGLGSGIGTVLVANAQGPAPAKTPDNANSIPEVVTIVSDDGPNVAFWVELIKDRAPATTSTEKWEYRFDRKPIGYAPTVERFMQTLKATEKDGWDFVAQLKTAGESPDQPELPTLVFRRPNRSNEKQQKDKEADKQRFAEVLRDYRAIEKPQDARAQKIAALEAELAALKGTPEVLPITFLQKDLPIGISELQDILGRVAPKIGFKSLESELDQANGGSITIHGDKAGIDWAKRFIESITSKPDATKSNPYGR